MLFVVEVMMLRGGEVNDIIELKRQGLSVSQISAMSGYWSAPNFGTISVLTLRKHPQTYSSILPLCRPPMPHVGVLQPLIGHIGTGNMSLHTRSVLGIPSLNVDARC